jgi:hypothetical protein
MTDRCDTHGYDDLAAPHPQGTAPQIPAERVAAFAVLRRPREPSFWFIANQRST